MTSDAVVFWLGTSEDEIHFIDAVISAYDGLAALRRDFRIINGRAMYKVFVSPGMEDEFLEIVARLRSVAAISDLIREDDLAPSSDAYG
jgi:hypothetical protein